MSIKESKFNEKKWVKIFTFAYGQPDRKISLFLRVALESLVKSNFFLHSCTQQGTQTRQNLIFAQDVDENVM